MVLTPGTTLGHFEILSSIGAGGMGEVYCTWDTKLKREVAIKVLPGHLAESPESLERFEREAQAVAVVLSERGDESEGGLALSESIPRPEMSNFYDWTYFMTSATIGS